MPTSKISIPPATEHVRVVRMVAAAAARRGRVPEESIDLVRQAVGEAVARVVLRHLRAGVTDDVVVSMREDPQAFEVEIADKTPVDLADDDDGLSVALTSAFAPQADFSPAGREQRVRLVWPLVG